MRVLHVCSGNLYGGVERVLVTLARERNLCPEMDPYFAVCFAGQLSRELQEAGVPVFMLKEMRGRQPFSIVENRSRLRRLNSELRIDTVLFHSLWSYCLLGLGSKTSSVANALWFHDAVGSMGMLELLASLRKPDVLVSNSLYTAQSASKLYPKAEVGVVYCPVPYQPIRIGQPDKWELRRSLETADQDVVIVQPSRMEEWKGHKLHLAALTLLKDLAGWKLWIVGGAQRPSEQAYLEDLQRQAREGGIADRVRFLGHRNDIPNVLAAADIHCQPNVGPEPFGITFIEGLMAELPLVTVRIGAAVEIVDQTCGLLSEPDDIQGLAANLRALISDKEQRRRLGRCGPKRAQVLCNVTDRMNDLYQCILGGKSLRAESPHLKSHRSHREIELS